MAKRKNIKNKKNISNLYINKLKGRMLILPPKNPNKKREILLLYGHHASLERMTGIADNLSQYGTVTMPDLPGFGGMKSFYTIGKQPSIDNFADYLASFIKLKYKRKRLTIISMSFSFLAVTKMLQKNLEIAKKVDLLISTVGFVHHEDFKMDKKYQFGLKTLGGVFQYKFLGGAFRFTALSAPVIKSTYKLVANKHGKMSDAESKEEFNRRVDAEVELWHINDVRTRMKTMKDMFKVDLCNKKVNLTVHHVWVSDDRYFDNKIVEQHMRIIYKDFVSLPTTLPAHMPSIVATSEDAAPFVPKKLRQILNS